MMQTRLILPLVTLLSLATASASGQDVILQEGAVRSVAVPASPPSQPKAENAKKAESKPSGDSKSEKDADKAKESGDKSKDKKEPEPPIIRRSDVTAESENLEGLKMRPDAQGRVRFNVEGAPWLMVLKWLADISNLSLDWQELPGDYLNLRTQESYSVEEAQDIINRHLLARGFTMLRQGEVLSVVNVKKINPGLVPRVRPDELEQRRPHEFVKVSFPLDWMLAEEAVKELTPMRSPNGTLTALKSTNRIEAMDAVLNLREIYTLLQQEQSREDEQTVIRVFPLMHVRAEHVIVLLQGILGLENQTIAGGNVSDSMGRQIMQQLQQMQRKLQNNKSSGGGSGGNQGAQPKLIVDERRNSIIAHAPPDKMEIIAQTVDALDVPQEQGTHILQQLDQMKVYRLSTLDPQPLVDILTELGQLSPSTKIEVDPATRSILVYGSLADHVTVQALVNKLDGSTRSFEVIPLRRLRADAVAGTIQYMLGAEEEQDNTQASRYSYYYYRESGSSGNNQDDKRPFRVDADIENNRLLLWANEVELTEVQNLLVKMGEMPSGVGSDETLRVIDLNSDGDAQEVLDRIRRLWPNVEPNELKIQPSADAQPKEDAEPDAPAQQRPVQVPDQDDTTPPPPKVVQHGSNPRLELTGFLADPETPHGGDGSDAIAEANDTDDDATVTAAPSSEAPAAPPDFDAVIDALRRNRAAAPSGPPPPVTIQRAPNGRLILNSADTRALDRLEEMLDDLSPPRRDYKVFKLKNPNTWAYGIEFTLEEIFAEEMEQESMLDWYGNVRTFNESGPGRLSQRKPLKIIADSDTQTILVQGATTDQLKIIEDIIDIYDQPQSNDPQMIRRTEVFRIQYSQAQTIADTVKAVYRDLLSENDPALQQNKKDEKETSAVERSYTYIYGGSGNTGSDDEQPSPIRFKGLLSVGVDDVSNSVVVNSVGGLMTEISELITALDDAAKPDIRTQVIQINGGVDIRRFQERLKATFNPPKPQQQPGQQPNGQPQNGQQRPGGNPRTTPQFQPQGVSQNQ